MVEIKHFIDMFKNTSYYSHIMSSCKVLAMWIAGSTCMKCDDEDSDYDIVILTLDGDIIDASRDTYITYRDKRIHWYYQPIYSFFEIIHVDVKTWLCGTQLHLIDDDLFIYINPEYTHIVEELMTYKAKISRYSFFKFFETQYKYIKNIFEKDYVENYKYAKFLYHLCWYSYIIYDELPDYDLLRKVKRFNRSTISIEENKQVVRLLKRLDKYISDASMPDISDIYRRLEEACTMIQ